MPVLVRSTDRIQRTKLHDEVLTKLSGLILRGDLAPGSRVQERVLCEQLGISRTPLREGLKVLASSGLVELQMNRGARIAPLRAVEVAESFDVLALLERRAGELVATRLDDATVRELCGLHRTMIGHSHRQGCEPRLRADLKFHHTIVRAAGNRTLASTHEALAIKVERARYLSSMSSERVRHATREHEVILQAILARNPAQIAEALYAHCLNTRDAVVAAVMARYAEDNPSEAA